MICAWLRARRLERAQLKLADAHHDEAEWAWADTPSKERARERRIAKLEAKVDALSARAALDTKQP